MNELITCTLDSGRFIFRATSSRMNISGYRVLANNVSRTSSCVRVNVVRSRRCFLGLPTVYTNKTKLSLTYIIIIIIIVKIHTMAIIRNRLNFQHSIVIFVQLVLKLSHIESHKVQRPDSRQRKFEFCKTSRNIIYNL